jgi:hypothetical protein
MPGFIDPHTHFSVSVFLSSMHDLSGFTHQSNQEVWDYFEKIVKESNKGEWIVCKGIDPVLVKDLRFPDMAYLNRIAPENPVLIFSQSLHNYWANSAAFDMAGITKDSPNPSPHSYYGKDAQGALNGLIVEQAAIKPFFDLLKEAVLPPEKLGDMADEVMSDYAENGHTTIVSAGITINDDKPLVLFKHLSAEQPSIMGSLLEKIGMLPPRKPRPRHFIYMRHDQAALLPEKPQKDRDFYNIIGIKHWYDGSPYSGTMYLQKPYLNSELTRLKLSLPEGHRGHALRTQEAFKKFIRDYHGKGWQIAVHVQGDAAVKEVLDCFEELDDVLDYSGSRHRLEHCLLLSKDDLPRMKKLHISPSFHINHLYYYGEALRSELLGPARAANIFPLASTAASGSMFSLHADQPMFESKPFRLIQTAVERKTISGNLLGATEQISLMEALKSMTLYAAWQIGMEDKIGSLEKGKYADFIILDRNPLETPVQQLEDIQCVQTFVHGNPVY